MFDFLRRLVRQVRAWHLCCEGDVPPDSSIDSLLVSPRVPRVLRVSLISVVLGGSALAAVLLEQRQSGPALSPVTIRVEPGQRAEPVLLPPRSIAPPAQTPNQVQDPRDLVDERILQAPTEPQWKLHERVPQVPLSRPIDGVVRANKQPPQITRANPKAANQPTSSRTLAKKNVQDIVQLRMGRVLVCYDKLLAAQPHLEGIVQAEFTIMLDGAVASVTAHGLDPEVAVCIEEVLRGARFKPVDQEIHVTYPFRLGRP